MTPERNQLIQIVADQLNADVGCLTVLLEDRRWVVEVSYGSHREIEVIVAFPEGTEDRDAVLTHARAWLARLRKHECEYRDWSAERLRSRIPDKTVAEIAELLQLLSIECSPDGTARLYWDDDDQLFAGHG